MRMGVSIFSEITERKLGERMIGTLIGGTTVGGLLCSFAFEELKD